MSQEPSFSCPELLNQLVERRDLSATQTRAFLTELMAGRCGEAEAAALLVALRMKGETAEEIATAAQVLREHMVPLDTGRDDVLDTCGTGGDGSGTFNVSTAAALVAATVGVPVVKHGNRAVSGKCGSADVLAELGVRVEADVACARRCLERVGFAFCFAPHFHPALRHVAGVRRRLGIRSLFNCLGPLANPAGVAFQLLGVGRVELLDVLAGALARLGPRRALLVHGRDGLDEVSLTAPTLVREVVGGTVRGFEWTAADFGLRSCNMSDLRVDTAAASAAVVRSVLTGNDSPAARIVLANAAAALVAAERVGSPREGVALATEALASGRAWDVLQRLAACSRGE